jgi:pyruvate formate lyase activating enzyme
VNEERDSMTSTHGEESTTPSIKGWIWDIKKYALHDGPGIRTTVFFKGCPLRCLWCCNPESQSFPPQLVWSKEQCLHCGLCIEVCPNQAVTFDELRNRIVEGERCEVCGLCAERCPAEAAIVAGRLVSVGEVLEEVGKDAVFYSRSGGGLTLSGGEPLAQLDFASQLLRAYKTSERGRHTTVDTCGYVQWSAFTRILPYTDLFLYDVKHMDSEQHHRFTGVCNKLILENLARLADSGKKVIIRVPLIPECNDNEDNIRRTAAYARSLPGIEQVDLLPFHQLGEPKYGRLTVDYPLHGAQTQSSEVTERLKAIVEEYGLSARIGG